MRVAAYQAPLPLEDLTPAIELIREQVEQCAALGVEVLCFPEGFLGGLADYSPDPQSLALSREQVAAHLVPVARPDMTLIVGFSEAGVDGQLYNAAAVIQDGVLVGVYRKRHPAIRHSIYSAGDALPVFGIGSHSFGIVICYDSTFPELARGIADQGAALLFVPTNSALPLTRNNDEVAGEAHACDIERAFDTGMVVVRADVAGRSSQLSTPGATAITGSDGALLAVAEPFTPGLVVAEIMLAQGQRNGSQRQDAA